MSVLPARCVAWFLILAPEARMVTMKKIYKYFWVNKEQEISKM